jgi:predicted HicB family RNase H-like nuclease
MPKIVGDPKEVVITVRVDKRTDRLVKAAAKRKKMTVGVWVRDAISQYLSLPCHQ